MPSGSKRRKAAAAAKKKKDKSSNVNTSSSTTSLENDDPKIVEDDDVDVDVDVEISSPVSDEKRGDSPVRSYVHERTLEDVVRNDGDDEKKVVAEDFDGGAVVGAREVNVEEESEGKNGGAEYDESVKNGHNRSSSSSSSSNRSRSSSDDEVQAKEKLGFEDESRVVENNSLELEDQSQVVEKNSFELEDESPVVENNSLESEDQLQVVENKLLELEDPEKLNKEEGSLNPEATNVPDYVPTQEAEYNSAVETEPLAESVKLDDVLLEKVIPLAETYPLETSVISDVVEFGANEKDDHYTDYTKNDHATDDAKGDHDTDNAPTEQVHYNSVMETEPNVDSVKLDEPILEKVIPITGTNEKDDQLLPSLVESENNVTFGLVTDIEAEKVEDKAFPLSYEKDGGSSSANAPVTGARNGGEDIKYSEFPESSEKQPLLAPPPQQVQKTSWKSCCGLFDW